MWQRGCGPIQSFATPDYPYKWVGIYQWAAGTYAVDLHASGTPHASELLLITPIAEADAAALDGILTESMHKFFGKERPFCDGERIRPAARIWQTALNENHVAFRLKIPRDGLYVLFTQHIPADLWITPAAGGEPSAPLLSRAWESRYSEDATITAVAIAARGALQAERLNEYFQQVRFTDEHEFIRMKGVLHVQGADRRFVFQGVHTIAYGTYGEPWAQPNPTTTSSSSDETSTVRN